ncbi:2-succinyl-5-enolpyruvyl-6-hydroxy-3-cyclohexene-1-carboxylic-acid synthase [Algoriphagus halophilus]|uniref:2-succinyl-5-enolpyruvyl-6-hydroxy-3-cyclohexene-1-carboxylate synthase n=1 Tax=Algoriphagus halophilus TaxID=226505 RepID=A0A1N6DD53_9BACT|nr:2-succinyl-5-enolpyruvyl-6-hydroxy-3-cyclohexene-1-carboxylic-acid synthase [Algoriphagus halophilus]SIN68740.1 2-succinyl-5-enolpyruvyl-6-hydroxy-3-cyclohexene-1-carboxylate synthase [Algoriphagus halophilus]
MILSHIIELVAICAKKGIKNVILSPGSRCAPLTLAFARHPDIHTRTISDERSAAFIALGMAQQLEEPVALVCTSGSAALNYFPAVAEAFFQQIPLLLITADRPNEWIDQYDGQTIFQEGVYGKHVKGSFQFPNSIGTEDDSWLAARVSNEAINLSKQYPCGPVHLNIPLKEPFYPTEGESIHFPGKPRVFNQLSSKVLLSDESFAKLKSRLGAVKRMLVIVGQQRPNPEIQNLLNSLSDTHQVVFVSDCIGNMQSDKSITFHDHWLGIPQLNSNLAPDLIISFGKSIISKALKLFLRSTKASHWHIQEDGNAKDTFQRLTRILPTHPMVFFKWLSGNLQPQNLEFYQAWHSLELKVKNKLPMVLNQVDFGEYSALHAALQTSPKQAKIHVANSMSVRYLNFLGAREQEVCCNRGTSGIDGSSSTAVGCTFTTKELVTLVTGDMAFFYDRNAFWHNYAMPNLRIILLNNHAGGIFRIIKGPSEQPELEEFFETKQKLSAQHLATEFGFFYTKVVNSEELDASLVDFYQESLHPKILEIETESELNTSILKAIKDQISNSLME